MSATDNARVCVPVCVRRAIDLAPAIKRAAQVADVIELRLDCLDAAELDAAGPVVASELVAHARPFILTFRPEEQGGRRSIEWDERIDFRVDAAWPRGSECRYADLYDLELDLVLHLQQREREGRPVDELWPGGWGRVICSHHDFTRTSIDLEEIYARMAATPARVLKIAVRAEDVTDCIAVFRLLERARRDGREMIAIAMGEAGIVTRVLGPSRGAFLTFGSLDEQQATAPGQVSAVELRSLYRIDSITAETTITGLIGAPVAHSVSPHMHNAAFAARRMNSVYVPFEVRDAGEFIRRMVHPASREMAWNLRGLSVTAPHKTAIIAHLDRIDPVAEEIGAVNAIVVTDGVLHGSNTDAAASLAPLEGVIELRGAQVAIIGAGGASRAVLWRLREANARATVFARNVERASATARNFGAECESLEGANFDGFDVVINTTPLGTRGQSEDETPAVTAQLRGVHVAYDLVYNPTVTRFMHEAQDAGCRIFGGLPMLVAQAAAQFKLWTSHDAPLEVMHAAAQKRMLDVEKSLLTKAL